MEVSAEICWFWQGAGPAGLQGWFNLVEFHDCAAGGGGMRTDAYLSEPQQAELGIKLRQQKTGVEIKGLVAVIANGCQDRPFLGPIGVLNFFAVAQAALVEEIRYLQARGSGRLLWTPKNFRSKGVGCPTEAAMSSVARSQLKDIRNGLHLGSKHLER